MACILDLESRKQAWTKDKALKMILAATPSLQNKELDQAINLLLRIRDLVVRLHLGACVRTKYLRAAFQSPKSNALRLTVDCSVQLIDERKTQEPTKSWCLSDEAIAQGKCHTRMLPYSVFEVKLSGSGREMPPGIQDLVEGAEGLVVAEKFSKYQTGAAAFNQDSIAIFPHWASDGSFAALFGLPTKKLHQQGEGELTESTTTNSSSNTYQLFTGEEPSVPLLDIEETPATNRKGSSWRMLSARSSRTSTPQIAPKQQVRVEPKSYFANERTFIQWISAALLLFTVAVVLFDRTLGHGMSHIAATTLIFCGVFLASHALYTHYRRLRLLQSGSPYGYIDHVGPIIVTISIVLGLGIYLSEVGLGKAQPVLHQQDMYCHRHSLVGDGISPLAYEPSDLVYDEAHERLLTVSFSQITAIDVATGLDYQGHDLAESVIDLGQGADIEGLTMVGDVVYAISERKNQNSILYALSTVQVGEFRVVGEWQIPLDNTEGMTYMPDAKGSGPGKLLIASGNGIFAFDVPHLVYPSFDGEPPEVLTPLKKVFNGRMWGFGTYDRKVGALAFFEGVLYVLMDNARVIRGWDVDQGKILSQINLPTVGGGFVRQWEGMALRRVPRPGGQLRASSRNVTSVKDDAIDSLLVLDLALDTPGQVWSFVVEETGRPGQFKMPGCAAASYANHNVTDFETVAAAVNP